MFSKKPSIYTLSFNSSVDYTFYLPRIGLGDINRIDKTRADAGGKGLNVARMLTVLGCNAEALTFLGGSNGGILKNFLSAEGVKYRHVNTAGNTRSIFNFISGAKTLRFNEKGPVISKKEKKEILALIDSLNFKKGGILSISGSLPPGIEKDIYRRIIEKARRKGAAVALDADGDTLKEGIKGIPHIIKPNLWELERIAGCRINSSGRLVKILKKLSAGGISLILLTLGEKGAVLFSGSEFLYASSSPVKIRSTIGCGDAFLSGFLCGFSRNQPCEDCLRLAAACGAAKAIKEGTSMPSLGEVRKLLRKVRILKVSARTPLPLSHE
ncbi:MAG: 1-phosphofructokinase family hexose kinase [Candidatus Omnitrophica bacterium]|nr:1-phosphofructokinase family hexose kinase [Candidatus Omnitrophota bacterium]